MVAFDDAELRGEGFELRRLSADDVEALVRACNDPETQRWLPLPRPYRETDARWFIEDWAPKQRESGQGLVRAISIQGQFQGTVDLRKADWRVPSVEISYLVAPWARGQRLARRATRLLSSFAFDQGITRVELRAATDNDASVRTARGAGFTEEGTLRKAGTTHAGAVDLIVFSLLRSDQDR